MIDGDFPIVDELDNSRVGKTEYCNFKEEDKKTTSHFGWSSSVKVFSHSEISDDTKDFYADNGLRSFSGLQRKHFFIKRKE